MSELLEIFFNKIYLEGNLFVENLDIYVYLSKIALFKVFHNNN